MASIFDSMGMSPEYARVRKTMLLERAALESAQVCMESCPTVGVIEEPLYPRYRPVLVNSSTSSQQLMVSLGAYSAASVGRIRLDLTIFFADSKPVVGDVVAPLFTVYDRSFFKNGSPVSGPKKSKWKRFKRGLSNFGRRLLPCAFSGFKKL